MTSEYDETTENGPGFASARTPIATVLLAAVIAVLAGLTSPAPVEAQTGIRQGALNVFLDCNTFSCDSEYFRTEVAFVNWVRDRTVADVHLLMTSIQTGGGGNIFTLDFIGLEDLDGVDDQLELTTLATSTDDERLSALSRVIAAGLARYSALIGQADAILIETVAQDPLTDELVSAQDVDDPWNFWVFEIGTDFEMSGEETERDREYRGSFDASRTTDTWKFEFDARGNWSRDERDLDEDSTIVDQRTNWNTNLLLVYSIADNWSLGLLSGAGASTQRNQELSAYGAAAVEYSFFPYAEAPRRSLTARYDLQLQYYDWEQETIYDQTSELRPRHELSMQLFQRQPWGESRVRVTGRQFLHDLSLWSVNLFGDLEIRIVRGLSLELRGGIDFIEDQIYISAEGLTEEDILLGRYDRPTDYSYFLSAGLSFEFGSIFNNVVNNRFSGRGFGGGGGNF